MTPAQFLELFFGSLACFVMIAATVWSCYCQVPKCDQPATTGTPDGGGYQPRVTLPKSLTKTVVNLN